MRHEAESCSPAPRPLCEHPCKRNPVSNAAPRRPRAGGRRTGGLPNSPRLQADLGPEPESSSRSVGPGAIAGGFVGRRWRKGENLAPHAQQDSLPLSIFGCPGDRGQRSACAHNWVDIHLNKAGNADFCKDEHVRPLRICLAPIHPRGRPRRDQSIQCHPAAPAAGPAAAVPMHAAPLNGCGDWSHTTACQFVIEPRAGSTSPDHGIHPASIARGEAATSACCTPAPHPLRPPPPPRSAQGARWPGSPLLPWQPQLRGPGQPPPAGHAPEQTGSLPPGSRLRRCSSPQPPAGRARGTLQQAGRRQQQWRVSHAGAGPTCKTPLPTHGAVLAGTGSPAVPLPSKASFPSQANTPS